MAKDIRVEDVALPEIEIFPSTSGGVDLKEFEGTKTRIAKYEVVDLNSVYDEGGKRLPQGQTIPTKGIKVFTEKITEFDGPDGKIPVYATEILNMKKNEKGVWGLSSHEKATGARLMKKLKVSSLSGIVGKGVIVRVRESPNGTYLGFVI